MSRVFFREELEGVATFWRVYRKDGVTLGFTSHDRALYFGGIRHRAAPGMVPSAIRCSAGFGDDSAEVRGALSHASINAGDLRAGRYDDAAITIGAVDWETLEHSVVFHGTLGAIAENAGAFNADLRSAKTVLQRDDVPRTSPTCRARFCGAACGLSIARHNREAVIVAADAAANRLFFGPIDAADYVYGEIRWLDGPYAGQTAGIMAQDADWLVPDIPVGSKIVPGMRVVLREGCDRLFATCRDRFDNAVNFRGEPFLPGNDLIARYPVPQ